MNFFFSQQVLYHLCLHCNSIRIIVPSTHSLPLIRQKTSKNGEYFVFLAMHRSSSRLLFFLTTIIPFPIDFFLYFIFRLNSQIQYSVFVHAAKIRTTLHLCSQFIRTDCLKCYWNAVNSSGTFYSATSASIGQKPKCWDLGSNHHKIHNIHRSGKQI